GSKYSSTFSVRASNTTRAAVASDPAWVPGACFVRLATAARAASSVKLKRVSPNVAPDFAAIDRARSAAAPRDAPTMTASEAAGRWERKARAAASRAAADVDVTTRIMIQLPRSPCRAFRLRQRTQPQNETSDFQLHFKLQSFQLHFRLQTSDFL